MKSVVAALTMMLSVSASADVSVWEYNQLVDEYNELRNEYNSLHDKYNDLVDEYNSDTQRYYSNICESKDSLYNQLRLILDDYRRQLPSEKDAGFAHAVNNFDYDSASNSLKAMKSIVDIATDQGTCNNDGANQKLNKQRKEVLEEKIINIRTTLRVLQRLADV